MGEHYVHCTRRNSEHPCDTARHEGQQAVRQAIRETMRTKLKTGKPGAKRVRVQP